MVELSLISKYPFLNASKQYIIENNISIKELLDDPLYERARITGVERLDNAFKNRDVGNRSLVTDSDQIMELISYPIARMIAVCIDDIYFKRRYALGEAVHAYKNLINESTQFLINIANEFDLNVKFDRDTNKISIYFVDYLHHAPTRYKEWKMINREMKNGYIQISHKDLARIIQEALRTRINNELDERKCSKTVYDIFSSDIKRIQNSVMIHRKNIEAAPIGKLDTKKLPPCMKNILAAIQAGENVPHMGRFALVSFLHSLRLNNNEILKLFSTAPDFEEERTRYQVEHITGYSSSTAYTPPGCDKMRTYGICPTEETEELCKKKRHPLSYYKAKWKQENSKK
ncbi:MAG: hypothetical protein AYK22_08525 [Thermoplasmatales archaeon SG8-52-3]|nr:MAG: hypothetical protein AYK22_08525 [Thermoplasmatales archaeon SG8-52-3]